MRLISHRSEHVQKRELVMLFIFGLVLICIVGIFTTGWGLDAAVAVALGIAILIPWVLHRRRGKISEPIER
jgi:hypothetical protein